MFTYSNRNELRDLQFKSEQKLISLHKKFAPLLSTLPNVFVLGNVEFLSNDRELYFTEINSNVALYTQHKPFIDFDIISKLSEKYNQTKFIFSLYDFKKGNPDSWVLDHLKEKFGQDSCILLESEEVLHPDSLKFDSDTLYIIHAWLNNEYGNLTSDKLISHDIFNLYDVYSKIDSDYWVVKEPGKDCATGIELVKEKPTNLLSYPYISGDRFKDRRVEVVQYFIANRYECIPITRNFEYFVQLMVPLIDNGVPVNQNILASYGCITEGSVVATEYDYVPIENISPGDKIKTIEFNISDFSVWPFIMDGRTDWMTYSFEDVDDVVLGSFIKTVYNVYESVTHGSYTINGILTVSEGFQIFSKVGENWSFNKIESISIGDYLLGESGEIKIETIVYSKEQLKTYKICFSPIVNYPNCAIDVNGILILDF